MLQLEHVLERRPAQLAEGEKQRVAVARAIIREPVCFLFDEPLSRLDVQLRETMRGQIKEVLTGLNRATVIVTHDQLEALTMADRIAVMRDGVIEQVDTPHAVFSTPSNLFVAGFIGSPQMNLVSAQCQSCESGLATFRIGDQAMRIRVNPAVDRLAGTQVTLGIRPRSVELADEGSSADFQATVDLIEPMGAETLAHLVDGERDLRVVFDHRVRLAEGERVRIRFREGQTHVFDAGGQRVGS
jgi:ABC-type sugar transport system ATPase subunit